MSDTLLESNVKPLSSGDLDAVISIDAAASGVSRRGYFEKRLKAATTNPRDYAFVGVFERDDHAGFAFGKLVKGAFGKDGASAALDALGVKPGCNLKGIGQKLLDEVEKILRHKGVSTLTSQVNWGQWPVLNFLAHSGFKLAPNMVLTRSTNVIPHELEDDPAEDVREIDYSSPDGDSGNALSRDRIPIRSMKQGDLGKIISIDAASSGANRTEYFSRMQDENLNQSGVRVSLVAEQDGFPVGFIMARVDFGAFGRASSEAVLDAIGVDKGYRKQGVGYALMSKIMANLNILRAETVRTEVDWNATGLIDFFSAVGFTPAQRISLTKAL